MKKQLDRIQELESLIAKLPQGNITYKTIHGKKQPYLQWTEKGKTKSKYIKISERETVIEQVSLRRALQEELKTLKAETSSFGAKVASVSFETNVVAGLDLYVIIEGVRDWEKRDCFEQLQKYVNGSGYGRVCLVYGLRRTGKTTMILQALNEMSEEQLRKAVYIKAKSTDTMAAMDRDLRKLQGLGYKYIFIDEVTLMPDFIDSAALFSDIYAAMGMKIVLSGTDSLGFWFALRQELYDRAVTIHTTFIPYREHSRILGIDSIDEYIRYGGTLRAGELAFDDDDVNAEDASFRDDETTRRYIDTAICENIQH